MSICKNCNKFKDIVYSNDGEYLTVYVVSCVKCGAHKDDESWIE